MKSRSIRAGVAFALALAAIVAIASRGAGRAASADPPPLRIFHADSLSAYVTALARVFERAHPGVAVRSEGSGSLDALRKVTDLHLPCDILITADWRMLKQPHRGVAPWAVVFAGNSMGLLYTARSRGAAKINAKNWWRVLMEPGVRYGHSNPERDPAGYWALVMWQLAARYYHDPSLAARLAAHCPRANIRPHNIDLIALLQSGDLDYYFGYASDARLGKLKFLALPPEINLGDVSRAADYAQASVEIGSGLDRKRITGAPVAYAATLTANPLNRAAAIEFLRLMLGEAGRKAATDAGLIAYPEPFAWDPVSKMPRPLRALTRPLPLPSLLH
jgi:molybdate/tungstate transport system substrate-binding protein